MQQIQHKCAMYSIHSIIDKEDCKKKNGGCHDHVTCTNTLTTGLGPIRDMDVVVWQGLQNEVRFNYQYHYTIEFFIFGPAGGAQSGKRKWYQSCNRT